MTSNNKSLLFFEWVVVDNCNLLCDYCVNKGQYSHKQLGEMGYVPGVELQIAERIVEISKDAHKVIVNLTGGEPTISGHFEEMVNILSSRKNIEIQLITNFANFKKILPLADRFSSILVSVHAGYRSLEHIEACADAINAIKGKTKISLSQVDVRLSDDDRAKLALLTRKTGLRVCFQTYIPPLNEGSPDEDRRAKMSEDYVSSRGKRCSLGYTYYFINPDGSFYYGQWCNTATRKTGNFLAPLSEIQPILHATTMELCPFSYCGCNYNTFNYREYRAECKKLRYPGNQIFGKSDVKLSSRIKGLIESWKNRYLGK